MLRNSKSLRFFCSFFFIVVLFSLKPTGVAAQTVIPDQRFGFGGNCFYSRDLNIPWGYNWGYSYELNQCIPNAGRKVFLTLGKLDGGCEDGRRSTDDPTALLNLHGDEDIALYARLDNLLKSKFESGDSSVPDNLLLPAYDSGNRLKNANGGNSTECGYEKAARDGFLRIPEFAHTMPGAFYAIGNEPDWYPYISAADYVEMYNIYYARIKKYDPSAKVMNGGLLTTVKDSHYGVNDWINKFINGNDSLNNPTSPVDIWNIHPYVENTQNRDNNVKAAKDEIIHFRTFLNSNKPVWISEFGSTYEINPYDKDRTNIWPRVTDFMSDLLTWLKSSSYVQKWFWFEAAPPGPELYARLEGNVYKASNGLYVPNPAPTIQYNSLGTTYKNMAEQDTAKIPNCSILAPLPTPIAHTSAVVGTPVTLTVNFSVAQGNLSGNLSIGQNGHIIKDLNTTWNTFSGSTGTATFTWTPDTAGSFDLMCRAKGVVNTSTTECKGNPYYIDIPNDKSLPPSTYECAGPKAFMTIIVNNSFVGPPPTLTVPPPTTTPGPLLGDINNDNKVDNADYRILMGAMYQFGAQSLTLADINKDGKVDIFDYNIIVTNFGKTR